MKNNKGNTPSPLQEHFSKSYLGQSEICSLLNCIINPSDPYLDCHLTSNDYDTLQNNFLDVKNISKIFFTEMVKNDESIKISEID